MSITCVVAIYDTHGQAEHAIKELKVAGVDMKSLSIAAKDTHTDEHVVGYYNTGEWMMKYLRKVGAFWGGFWGLLFGSALFAIPGLGFILVAGPLVAWIVAGLEGAAVLWRGELNRCRSGEHRHPEEQRSEVRSRADMSAGVKIDHIAPR